MSLHLSSHFEPSAKKTAQHNSIKKELSLIFGIISPAEFQKNNKFEARKQEYKKTTNHAVRAQDIAFDEFGSHYRRTGESVVLHPYRIVKNLKDHKELTAAAWLHDLCEDTRWTLKDLAQVGFDDLTIDAVDSLTKRPHELYLDYIERLCANPQARRIKLADIDDNESSGGVKAKRAEFLYPVARAYINYVTNETTKTPMPIREFVRLNAEKILPHLDIDSIKTYVNNNSRRPLNDISGHIHDGLKLIGLKLV